MTAKNRTNFALTLIGMSLAVAARASAGPQPITYQGQLQHLNVPVNGEGRFSFTLWDAEVDGQQVGLTVETRTDIVNGLFTAQLDFGPGAFRGEPRWLEIQVATPQGEGRLSPRQPITPAPFALYALDAPGGSGGLWNAGLLGRINYTDGPVSIGTTAASGALNILSEHETALSVTATGDEATGIAVSTQSENASALDASANSLESIAIMASASGAATTALYASATGIPAPYEPANIAGSFYASGNDAVGILGRVDGISGRGVHGRAEGASSRGVFGEATAANGWGVYGLATGTNGRGVYGSASDPTGYAGVFTGRGYFSSDVGIGIWPEHRLHVKSGDAETIFSEATGTAGMALYAEATGMSGTAVKGVATYETGQGYGVRGITMASGGYGVWGQSQASTGVASGVKGQSSSPGGAGVDGANFAGGIGVKGSANAGGWAGYFEGATYVSGNLGVGTTTPATKLDVVGTIKSTGLELTSNAVAGHVLTSDASGVAHWQVPTGGIDLPFAGLYANPATLFELTNNGTGKAISGTSNNDTGVYGHSNNGAGIYGKSLNGNGVHGYGTGAGNSGAYGFCSSGQGVYGNSNTGIGVRAASNGTGTAHPAMYAQNLNGNGISLFSTSNSTDANAVFVNQGSGNIIKGFSGSGGGDLVFQVTNDGMTITNVLQITGGADLAEPFDVMEPSNAKPGMVVCIDADNAGKLVVCRRACDQTVAGVISGAGGINPGMIMGQKGSVADGEHPVALTGRVWTWCDTASGPIKPGDLLTTSDVAGHAMSVSEYDKARGAIIGKAMTSLGSGKGLVLVLVSLQ